MRAIPYPTPDAERVRAVLAGRLAPAPMRDAATVALLRDASGTPEVYMLRRTAGMRFAAGAFVFPGGSVDPRDADQAIGWAGPAPSAWGKVLDADERTARELVCAAVRETFEESGVLLAGPDGASLVADTTAEDWEADRLALIGRSLSLADFLARRRLVLRADLLRPWVRWVTPDTEPSRFDTRFFVAELPAGQRTRHVGGEADRVAWLSPARAMDAARTGEIMLLPPTYHMLADLAGHGGVAEILAAEREIGSHHPRVAEIDGELRLFLPDADYPAWTST